MYTHAIHHNTSTDGESTSLSELPHHHSLTENTSPARVLHSFLLLTSLEETKQSLYTCTFSASPAAAYLAPLYDMGAIQGITIGQPKRVHCVLKSVCLFIADDFACRSMRKRDLVHIQALKIQHPDLNLAVQSNIRWTAGVPEPVVCGTHTAAIRIVALLPALRTAHHHRTLFGREV